MNNAQQFYKTYSPFSKIQQDKEPNKNDFASNQFWNIGTVNKGHKTTKSPADFSTFDFWSQPPTSPETSKNTNFDIFSEKPIQMKEQKKVQQKKETKSDKNQKRTEHQINILSFDDLMKNCEFKKGPSPYQKKKNYEEADANK